MNYAEINDKTDDLLQQKILERSNMDQIFMNNAPPKLQGHGQNTPASLQNGQSLQNGPSTQSSLQSLQNGQSLQSLQNGSSLQHGSSLQSLQNGQPSSVSTAVIEKYLRFNPEEKRRFSLNNPSLYKTIMEELNHCLTKPVLSEPVSPNVASFSQIYNNENDSDSESLPSASAGASARKTHYISLDFRCDLKDIKAGAFVLKIPQRHRKQITYLELESCILPMMPVLEHESYIYMDFAEFEGDYVTSRRKVYGKLIREKQNGAFLHFLPENCKKILLSPLNTSHLTVSFYTYDGEPINLQHLDLQSITKNEKEQTILHTKCAHYLSEGDSLILSNNLGNKIIVEKIKVKHILDKNTYIINAPQYALPNTGQLDATVEKIDLKCTLTLKIQHKT